MRLIILAVPLVAVAVACASAQANVRIYQALMRLRANGSSGAAPR